MHGRLEEAMAADSKMSPNVSAAAHLNGSKTSTIIIYSKRVSRNRKRLVDSFARF
jgi:hypothetical protein